MQDRLWRHGCVLLDPTTRFRLEVSGTNGTWSEHNPESGLSLTKPGSLTGTASGANSILPPGLGETGGQDVATMTPGGPSRRVFPKHRFHSLKPTQAGIERDTNRFDPSVGPPVLGIRAHRGLMQRACALPQDQSCMTAHAFATSRSG
jgi:hypothetical protein